jgi:hypothetical protein
LAQDAHSNHPESDMRSTRRTFVMHLASGASLLAAASTASRAAAPKVDEADPQAAALGFKQDTTKVDNQKYPKHAATQHCGSCQLFQGKAQDASGGCALFAGKEVMANGWCSAWTQKAG